MHVGLQRALFSVLDYGFVKLSSRPDDAFGFCHVMVMQMYCRITLEISGELGFD